jgi:hypothetical protein
MCGFCVNLWTTIDRVRTLHCGTFAQQAREDNNTFLFCFFNGAYVPLNNTKGLSVAMEMQQWVPLYCIQATTYFVLLLTIVSIKYCVCVCLLYLVLVIWHANRTHSADCPAVPHSSTLSHKRYDFRKRLTEHKMCVLISSTTFVRKLFYSTKNSARFYHKLTSVSVQSTRFSCHILVKTWIFSTDCWNILKYRTSWNSVWWDQSCSMRVGGRTDGHKATMLFTVLETRLKKPFFLTVHYGVFTAWYEMKSLRTIQVNLTHASCAMAQAVSCRPITAEVAGRS